MIRVFNYSWVHLALYWTPYANISISMTIFFRQLEVNSSALKLMPVIARYHNLYTTCRNVSCEFTPYREYT